MLEINQLCFRYAPNETQWRFNITVPKGQCLAIQGPSGSGKSTLLSLIAGFLSPDEGQIFWDQHPIHTLYPWQRPVTSVFQEHNLFEHLDVFSNIGLGIHPGLKLTPSQRKAIDSGLERTGLAGFGARMPGELSGGQRQRVALLRALLRQQPILLLDEPMTGLDPETRAILYDMVLEEKQRGVTMLLASHDNEERRTLADIQWNL
ncbi:ATP-binding cassette domain-containing protein [Marinobacter daepoensis]|uniref:thiamine ABC transporter ATP-binding protein n=1 Tax=Marinobacter daepoensis TaxID=262077 RepID=UPI0003F5BE7F|nr:ATP-binding cassette domain-containing protein [Marinobacter daepoensis]